MRPLRPLDRVIIIGVGAALAATAAAYTLYPAADDAPLAETAANLAWTVASLLALGGSALAWRRSAGRPTRAGWRWLAIGCGLDLAAQLGADYVLLQGGAPSRLVALDDAVFVAVQPFFLAAAWCFLRRGERRRADIEIALDTVLLSLLITAVAIEYYAPPLAGPSSAVAEQTIRILLAVGAGAILWLVLVQFLRQTRFPRDPEGLALAGTVVYALTNLLEVAAGSPAMYAGGTPLDVGWQAGLGMIAVAGALGPSADHPAEAPAGRPSLPAPRLVVLVLGWAGIAWVITQPLLRGERAPGIALLVGIGIVTLALRFSVALMADRRYAARLEQAVERHTRTLSESLDQTAAAERDLRLLMEAVPDAIVVLDAGGRILDRNDAARAMVRAPADLADPGTVFDYLDAAGAAFVREKLARAFAGELVSFEVPFTRLDGSQGTSWVSYAPVREGDRIPRVMALARDVTAQRRTEAQLQQAERLASLGQLVSGVAHEINNPAAIISGAAQTLLLEPLAPEQREMVQTVYDEAIRIGGITSNLLTFARGSGTARTVVDVNEVARRTLRLRGAHHAAEGIEAVLDLDPGDPNIWANPPEIQQVLLNLVLNAEQALAGSPGARAIALRTRAHGAAVRIECADTGPGIDTEARARVFDPFFATSAGGGGTGLGLSVCYGIVRSHGGEISVDSTQGRGTTFTVTLPREASPAPHAGPAPGAAARRPLRVLLVEDEVSLVQAATRFLTRRDIAVVGVSDGAAALAAARAGEFDVVVTDARLPGSSGREFVERLRAERPALAGRLVLATGDPRSEEARAIVAATGAARIDKPFDLEQLEAAIRAAAERPTGPG